MAGCGYGYGHFADKVEWVYYKDLDHTLINSTDCPKQKDRSCGAKKCCLGEKIECRNNDCPNNR